MDSKELQALRNASSQLEKIANDLTKDATPVWAFVAHAKSYIDRELARGLREVR